MRTSPLTGRARRLFAIIGITSSVTMGLTACASQTEEPGVLSLNDPASDATAVAEADQEAQALAFAQCMRDNGVDFPDPTVDADGNVTFANAVGEPGADGGFDPGDDSFTTAIDECGDLMEGIGFGPGGGGPGGEFDQTEIQDALFEYTECLRSEGLDVGDIEFGGMPGTGEPGPGAGEGGGEPGPGAGGPPEGVTGGGFDPLDMIAEQLGYDPSDPAWVAANEVCESPLQGGLGGPQGGGQ